MKLGWHVAEIICETCDHLRFNSWSINVYTVQCNIDPITFIISIFLVTINYHLFYNSAKEAASTLKWRGQENPPEGGISGIWKHIFEI